MNEFSHELIANCELIRPPFLASEFEVRGHKLPSEFLAILRVSNGLISKRRIFRVFGTDSDQSIPSILDWNDNEWKREFRELAQNLLFIAEDIFGDQYGYMIGDGGRKFVKFYCEGGKTEEVHDGINRLIQAIVDPRDTGLLDLSLVDAAFSAALKPNANEHLAFRVPLIVGGAYEVGNLCIEDLNLHLGTLAQISVRNASLPEGTSITRFS